MGIRRVSQLALPAYLSASFLTRDLQGDLLAGNSSLPDPYLDDALKSWSSSSGPFPPLEKLSSQAAWDAILIREDKAQIEEKLSSPRERAIYLAANAPHSGDWLSAMPLANCGLKLDDEAIRVGVALRLGLPLCCPHECSCGALVDAWGSHAFVCKKAPGRILRHQALNDIVARAFTSAEKPVRKEPAGLVSGSGKRPDGATSLPWRDRKLIAWDVTVATTLAE